MQREAEDEGFKIDHFFPTTKGGSWTAYENHFLSCDRCNQHKSDHWPTKALRDMDIRYLNCCEEIDYGLHIFEGLDGTVFSETVPGKYHIRMLQLNRPDLIRLRQRRSQLLRELEEAPMKYGGLFKDFASKLESIKTLVSDLIPPIASKAITAQ